MQIRGARTRFRAQWGRTASDISASHDDCDISNNNENNNNDNIPRRGRRRLYVHLPKRQRERARESAGGAGGRGYSARGRPVDESNNQYVTRRHVAPRGLRHGQAAANGE